MKVLGVMWFVLLVSGLFCLFGGSQHKHMWFEFPPMYESEEKDHKLPWKHLIIWSHWMQMWPASIVFSLDRACVCMQQKVS